MAVLSKVKNMFKQQNVEKFVPLMERFSRTGIHWEFNSRMDNKMVDALILEEMKKSVDFATLVCEKNKIPFILYCVECNMIDSVIWYINNGGDLSVVDTETDNIALYAYNNKIPEIVKYCACEPVLAEYENNKGISLNYLLERDRKRKEIREKLKQEEEGWSY